MIHSIVVHVDPSIPEYTLADGSIIIYDGDVPYVQKLINPEDVELVNGVGTIVLTEELFGKSLPIVGDRVRLQRSGDDVALYACEVEVNGIPLDECGTQNPSENIDGISSNVLDGEDCMLFYVQNVSILPITIASQFAR